MGSLQTRASITISKYNGRKAIIIRSIITDPREIEELVTEALTHGCARITTCASFRNIFLAVDRLHKEGLINFSLRDITKRKLPLFLQE